MTASELLAGLRAQGIDLWLEGERLRFRAPKGALTPQLRDELSASRERVVRCLRDEAANQTTTCPLSFSQRSLWFLHQQAPGATAYHVALSARVRSAIDRDALRLSLQALIDRHAVLRTTYAFVDDAPCQQAAGAARAALELHDAADLDEATLRAAVEADYRRPFDLERGPVFRASLYSCNPQDHVLLLAVHHIAADGWSLLLLVEELRRLYEEATGGAAAELARPSAQYSDYVRWQEEFLAGAQGERLWSYWRGKLAPPLPLLELPADRPRPAVQSFRGASLPLRLHTEQASRLRQFARSENATLFVVLLASFHAFLFRLTGAADIIIGTPTFGRSKPAFIRVVGDFVNSVPLRCRLDSRMSFRALVGQLRDTVLEALDAQEFPLPLLVQRLQPGRDPGRSPLFDVFFLLQRFDQFRELEDLLTGGASQASIDFGGLRLAGYPLDQQEGQFDLALQFIDRGEELHGVLKYSSDLFDAATVERFAADYLSLVTALDRDPDIALGALPAPARNAAGPGRMRPLLDRLRNRDVRLSCEGGRLRVNAPKGALDDDLRREIALHRDEIVAALQDSVTPGKAMAQPLLRPITRGALLHASSAQRRLWLADRMEPGSARYNIGFGVRFRGPLKADLLVDAVERLVRRHESLRTRFVEADGDIGVAVLDDIRSPVERVDLSAVPAGEREGELRRRCDNWFGTPFNLVRGPLAAHLLITISDDDHLLAVRMHHAVSDGWSIVIAVREICQFYDALAAGGEPLPAPLPIQYADYAAWEREQVHASRVQGQLAYWKQALAGAPAVLELPTDRPRPAVQSRTGRRLRVDFAPGLIDELKALCRGQDATLYMALLAAWQVLLHRYSGEDDIVVGSPIANRETPALEGLIGCFVNNLVLRGRLAGNPRFDDFLRQVKATVLQAFEHRDLPFDVLVERLRPERSASHTPLFQVFFALQSFPTDYSAPAGTTMEIVEPQAGPARYDLALEIVEREGRFSAAYEYATELFDEETVERLHDNFERLLQSIVADPDRGVQDLRLLSVRQEKTLAVWNDTGLAHDRSRCVHHLLEASARARPEAVAVVAGGDRLSYRELDERANRLAWLLAGRGAAPGSRVAICLDRSCDMAVAMAGVLKAGAAYVPLDPGHPADRLRYTLQDAGVACVLSQSTLVDRLGDPMAPVVLLDEAQDELARLPAQAPGVDVTAESLAYVIYTSGSTGRPKGVQVEHRNLVSFLEAMRVQPGFSSDDVLLAVTTLSFDISGLELWLPLSVGGQVVIASRTDVLDGARLAALLDDHRATVMQATPATWRSLLQAGWGGRRGLRALCGGEALPGDLAGSLLGRVAELWNMYGPTETTVWSTAGRVAGGGGKLPIGRPIANTRAYVLEPAGQPAPIGVAGELCIGGEGVARGYRNRDELNVEKFVEISWPDGRTERVYRTGDVARFLADGQLEFIGRRDHQVKIRGYRVELGEIEAVLAACPGVEACVAIVREDAPGDQRLAAYLVPMPDAGFDLPAIRERLRAKLPEYMVPNFLVQLPALPLTPNGKIDRKALPRPQASPAQEPETSVSLMTPGQRGVAAIWRQVLGVERVGLHDNFFDVGGHSLLLVRLHDMLTKRFGRKLELVDLFQRTTVAAQADLLARPAVDGGALHWAQAGLARQIHG